MKKILIVILCLGILAGCVKNGANTTVDPKPTVTPTVTPAVTPESTPSPEPEQPVSETKTIGLYLPNSASGIIERIDKSIEIDDNTEMTKIFDEMFRINSEDYIPLITENTNINSIKVDESKMLVSIDLSQHFINEIDVGAGLESTILNCIATTIGEFYNMKYAQITIDGQKYESGHISRDINDYIEVGAQ